MFQILHILLAIIAPIIVIAGLGVLLDKTKPIDTQPLSRIVIYLTTPSLVFYGIVNSSIQSSELGQIILCAFLSIGSITLVAWAMARLFRMNRLTSSAFVLSVSLINLGNYGIPVNEFAFGPPGLERALLMTVLLGLHINTAGIFIASWGRASLKQAATNILRVPTPYMAVLGFAVNWAGLPVPELILRVTKILGDASIPLMLLMLGIQVSRASLRGQWGLLLGAAAMRLVGGAAVAFLCSNLLGLEGVTWQVMIVESAMPTAVYAAVLAAEFDSDTMLVSGAILVSTLLSVLTLPVVLYLMLNGM
jgi:hypothetical protein